MPPAPSSNPAVSFACAKNMLLTTLEVEPPFVLFEGIILHFWETAHLPLPSADINTSYLAQNVGLGEG